MTNVNVLIRGGPLVGGGGSLCSKVAGSRDRKERGISGDKRNSVHSPRGRPRSWEDLVAPTQFSRRPLLGSSQ
jgi:hypothetical protein